MGYACTIKRAATELIYEINLLIKITTFLQVPWYHGTFLI